MVLGDTLVHLLAPNSCLLPIGGWAACLHLAKTAPAHTHLTGRLASISRQRQMVNKVQLVQAAFTDICVSGLLPAIEIM